MPSNNSKARKAWRKKRAELISPGLRQIEKDHRSRILHIETVEEAQILNYDMWLAEGALHMQIDGIVGDRPGSAY